MVIMLFKRVRDLREDNDYTQKQIAEILKIHQTTYSDYEIGNLNIPVDVLIELAKLYNTSIDYIVGLTDETKPYK
jgi:transcriptional regulator with XRE-family HTH domain